MKKPPITHTILSLLALLLLAVLFACSAKPSASVIETAVAGTVAVAPPAQSGDNTTVIKVTQIVEVTKIVVVQQTATPKPTVVATSTATPAPTEPATATPTASSNTSSDSTTAAVTVVPSGDLNLTLNGFILRYKAMTDLQKEGYAPSLVGKSVYWTAEVDNVTAEGLVILDNPYASGRVILLNVPTETAIKFDRGMLVDFKGMIESFSGKVNPEITLIDVKILRTYWPPTATPTPGH